MPLTKSQIRHTMIDKRMALSAQDQATAANALKAHVSALIPEGAVVGGYVPIRAEADIMPALEMLSVRGHQVGLPVTGEKETLLAFRYWQPGDKLVRGKFNVQEPEHRSPLIVPDIVLVPLVAFDDRFYRIGYGAGYYDRTIHMLRKGKKPITCIGVAYAFQQVSRVPTEAHDEPLDKVIFV